MTNASTDSNPPFTDYSAFSRRPFGESTDFTRILFLGAAYCGAILLAHWCAYLIRFEFSIPQEQQLLFWHEQEWRVPLEIFFLVIFGQFRSLLSYFSLPDARRIGMASATTGLVSIAIWYYTGGKHAPPRSIITLSFVLDSGAVGSVRLSFRMLRERQGNNGNRSSVQRRMVIIGAGDVGANLAKEMKLRRDLCMRPIAFFDDDRGKWNTHIHGVPVVGRPELLAKGKVRADEAIIAMPSASGRRIREVVQILNEVRLRFETVPSVEQIINGVVRASQIRPVQIEDLLGRELISLETDRIREFVFGKVVMVTGAGGSIGSELCRQIAKYNPARLLLVERCEVQIFQIEQEMMGSGLGAQMVTLVADILDEDRIRGILTRFRPDLIFHAAAHKHVPMMESQPFESFRNNTLGTILLANLASEFQVGRFVLISTDKAINPTNVMGATKRLAELYIQALQRTGARNTKFMAVRFGNVLGSSGSVIPTFKKQIAAGGPVTVTHIDVTRYFMTVHEAVGLVLQSTTQGQGGEIFVLDMGKLVKVVDVAKQLIELSGLRPEIDIEIKFTGLRPGEKLFEEINHNTENMAATSHSKIMRFVSEPMDLETIRKGVLEIRQRFAESDSNKIKLEIQRMIPEYKPYLDSV